MQNNQRLIIKIIINQNHHENFTITLVEEPGSDFGFELQKFRVDLKYYTHVGNFQ